MTDVPRSTGVLFADKRKRNSLSLLIGLLLAFVLLGWLFTSFSVLDADVWGLLGRQPWAIGGIAFTSAFLMTLLSAAKWQMLLKRAAPELAHSVKAEQLFAYSAMSSALGQILPPYIAGPVVRGAAMKLEHKANFARNAMLAGYEQVFDVVALVVGGIAALFLLLSGISGITGVVVFSLITVSAATVVYMLPDRFRPMQEASVLPKRWPVTRRIRNVVEAGSAAGLDTPQLLGHLMALSVVRYAVLVVRSFGMGLILLPLVPWTTVTLGFGAVQLSSLAALTPGNLGITELGWGAMTAFTDLATMGELVAFALALRVSGLVASAVLATLALLWLRRP